MQPADLLEQAKQYTLQGRFNAALRAYWLLIDLFRELISPPETFHHLVAATFALANWDKADDIAPSLAELPGFEQREIAYAWRMIVGRWAEARFAGGGMRPPPPEIAERLAELRRALDVFPDDADPEYAAAARLAAAGDLDGARRACVARLAADDRPHPPTSFLLGTISHLLAQYVVQPAPAFTILRNRLLDAARQALTAAVQTAAVQTAAAQTASDHPEVLIRLGAVELEFGQQIKNHYDFAVIARPLTAQENEAHRPHFISGLARLRRALALRPERIDLYNLIYKNLPADFAAESVALYREKRERELALQDSRLGGAPIRAIRLILDAVGHMFIFEIFIKARRLGMLPPVFCVFIPYRCSGRYPNPAMLDYWRAFDHELLIADRPELIDYWRPVAERLAESACVSAEHDTPEPNGAYWASSFGLRLSISGVLRAWRAAGGGPVLTLKEEHRREGRRILAARGMGEDDWFVALHVRDRGFYQETASSFNDHRNADIDNYLEAIRAVVDRGGWVIRMGDPSSKPLPPMERVIDYARDPARCDWMDVFLWAECRFFCGGDSGPVTLPTAFSRPRLLVNVALHNILDVCTEDDLFIAKMMRRRSDGRPLPFADMAQPEFRVSRLDRPDFLRRDIEFIENAPDEIREAMTEMLDRLDGVHSAHSDDDALQARFEAAARVRNDMDFIPRPAAAFLRKHAALL